MSNTKLVDVNRFMFASLLPATHGIEPKAAEGAKKFSKAEIKAAAAAGVDPASLSPDELVAVMAAASMSK